MLLQSATWIMFLYIEITWTTLVWHPHCRADPGLLKELFETQNAVPLNVARLLLLHLLCLGIGERDKETSLISLGIPDTFLVLLKREGVLTHAQTPTSQQPCVCLLVRMSAPVSAFEQNPTTSSCASTMPGWNPSLWKGEVKACVF